MLMENSSNDTTKVVLGFAVGCLVVILCLVAATISCVGGILWVSQSPEGIAFNVNAPVQVDVGDTVLIEVQIVNDSAQQAELSSIDVSQEYLDGIVITSSSPAYESTSR